MGPAASSHYGMVALRRWQHGAVQVSETIDALMADATIEGEDERLAKSGPFSPRISSSSIRDP